MDRLDEIFRLQAELDEDISSRHGLSGISREEWIQREILAIVAELGEVLNEANYKWWKVKKPIDDAKLNEEITDVFHFFVSLCIKAGITPAALFEAYKSKNSENMKRQHGQSDKKGYNPEQ